MTYRKKRLLVLASVGAMIALLLLSACGNSSSGNEVVGQVKRVVHRTPVLCGDYDVADISMGVMRGNVGSVSREDLWVEVTSSDAVSELRRAAETGAIVHVTYEVRRAVLCGIDERATAVSVEPVPVEIPR